MINWAIKNIEKIFFWYILVVWWKLFEKNYIIFKISESLWILYLVKYTSNLFFCIYNTVCFYNNAFPLDRSHLIRTLILYNVKKPDIIRTMIEIEQLIFHNFSNPFQQIHKGPQKRKDRTEFNNLHAFTYVHKLCIPETPRFQDNRYGKCISSCIPEQ